MIDLVLQSPVQQESVYKGQVKSSQPDQQTAVQSAKIISKLIANTICLLLV